MSNDPKLVAELRDSVGTSSAKRLRESGRVPGNLYGHKLETVSFSISDDVLVPILKTGHKVVDFELNGQQEKAMIQEVQWDTFSKYVQHFDLLRVDENERIHANVLISLKGTAPGVLGGGILQQPHHTIPVECPVIRLPNKIELRIGSLEVGQSIHVSDLELPPEVTTTLSPSEVLVQVVTPKMGSTEEEEAEEEDSADESSTASAS